MLQTLRMRPRHFLRPTWPPLKPLVIAVSLVLPGVALGAGALPSGGRFVAGAGSITGNTTSLTINQTSGRGIIDWNSFSIGTGNHVSIDNGTGATLNRVTGANPSSILGSLSATGSVYLINPQGIVVGGSGVISTGGRFVASTLDTDNTAFMNGGPLTFVGTSNGTVVNFGNIASSGGDVFLIASEEVDNVGTLSAPKGSAEIAAGQQLLLKDSTTSQQVFVQNASNGKIVNRGTIEAAQISLQAADGNIFALAGQHSVLRATGTATRDGHVWLVADTGRVWLDGTVQASNANGSGGTVDTNAAALRIAGGPTLLANQWNITTPSFTINAVDAPVFQRNLDRGTSINLQTSGAGGASGDIEVASSIHWVGAASLTLGAYHSLTIEAAVQVKNCGHANLTLRADSQSIDNGGSIANKGTVDWSTSRGIVSLFYDMSGTYSPGKLLANTGWTSPADSGLLTQITSYKLVNSLADLEHVSSDLAGNYALGKDIDASATSNGSYVPIGSGSTAFTGQFDGQGHSISSLTMTGTSGQAEGMFATLGASALVRDLNVNGNASISNSDFANPSVSGTEGILAAYNNGTILRVNTSGTLGASTVYFGGDFTTAGGLVGVNHGAILRSSSSVSGSSNGTLGGLVGENDGSIARSYASGALRSRELGSSGPSSEASPGGLVGTNNGTITQSYATGSVTNSCLFGNCSAAGLVNTNYGTITQSYATGAVANSCSLGPCTEAGLVNTNNGTITESFATGAVPASADWPSVENYGIAAVNNGTIKNNVYWNKDTTTVAIGVGSGNPLPDSNGLTTAAMSDPKSFAGWNFAANGVWTIPAGYSHPILQWQVAP